MSGLAPACPDVIHEVVLHTLDTQNGWKSQKTLSGKQQEKQFITWQ